MDRAIRLDGSKIGKRLFEERKKEPVGGKIESKKEQREEIR